MLRISFNGINIAVDNGLLSPVVARITETARNHHASMTGQQLKSEIYGEKIYTEVNDARGGSYLSECTKMALGGMGFGRFINLNNIRVHFGIPDSVISLAEAFGGITPKAITIGDDIYYARRSDYNPSTVAGLAEMGHEVTHSIQFKILGASMYFKYLGQWAKNKFRYGEGMKLERFAAEVERNLNSSIPQRFGYDPCKKFRQRLN